MNCIYLSHAQAMSVARRWSSFFERRTFVYRIQGADGDSGWSWRWSDGQQDEPGAISLDSYAGRP